MKKNTFIQKNYRVLRNGLERLCIILEGFEEHPVNPRIMIQDGRVVFIHDNSNSVMLTGFPQEWMEELTNSGSVIIGERHNKISLSAFGIDRFSSSQQGRFYEAVVGAPAFHTEAGHA